MVERLGQVTRFPIQKLYIDFSNKGWALSDQWEDVTDYVLEINGSKEKSGENIGSITSDYVNFIVDNSDKEFSKDNTRSPFYGKVKSNLRYKLMAGFRNETLQEYASGYIEKFVPTWSDNKYSISTIDFFKTFKKTPPPKSSFKNINLEGLINVLCDTAGLPSHIERVIPATEYYYSYFKFTEENCFDALANLMKICVGSCYFEQSKFIVKTKLALDYQLDTTEKFTITADDIFTFDEPVENTVINDVTITSNPPIVGATDTIWKTPENEAQVQGETVIYDGSGVFYLTMDNMPVIDTTEKPITIRNLTKEKDLSIESVNALSGKVTLDANSIALSEDDDILSVSYYYQQLVINAGFTRTFQAQLENEVDNITRLDCVVWDRNGENKLTFSNIPNTPNSVSLQSLIFDREKQIVSIELKNNYLDHITISTLQLVGFPINKINPIEAHVNDGDSIVDNELHSITIDTTYINNIRLAEKIAQFIIDNNKDPRKKISVKIDGFPELILDTVVKVIEDKSGTNDKFTVERIDFSYTVDDGWSMTVNLLELETVQWVYENFSGISYGKTDSSKKESVSYKVEVVCYDTNIFRNGQGTKTLFAQVFDGAEEITSLLEPEQFNWRRVSSKPSEDALWNATHLGLGSSITIQSSDINSQSVIFCDILV